MDSAPRPKGPSDTPPVFGRPGLPMVILLILGAVALATVLTGFTVIATASRPESAAWCRKMGAHHVIDHSGDWPAELAKL